MAPCATAEDVCSCDADAITLGTANAPAEMAGSDDSRMPDDATLNKVSKQILSDLEEVKRLEQRKRQAARSTPEFHELAEEVERAARHVWEHAQLEERIAEEDSPIPAERAEQEPGDWTRHGDN